MASMTTDQPLKMKLFASATFSVQLADSVQYRSKRRLDVHAEVDPRTGEVRLFVDPKDLTEYLKNN